MEAGELHEVDISRGVDALADEPDEATLRFWLQQAMNFLQLEPSAVSVRIVGSEEMIELNVNYREKNKVTNVLSFSSGIEDEQGRRFLGDIVICNEVVLSEGREYGVGFAPRFSHMMIHGLLHLMGHDHEKEQEREIMEGLEKIVLHELNMKDPYEVPLA